MARMFFPKNPLGGAFSVVKVGIFVFSVFFWHRNRHNLPGFGHFLICYVKSLSHEGKNSHLVSIDFPALKQSDFLFYFKVTFLIFFCNFSFTHFFNAFYLHDTIHNYFTWKVRLYNYVPWNNKSVKTFEPILPKSCPGDRIFYFRCGSVIFKIFVWKAEK